MSEKRRTPEPGWTGATPWSPWRTLQWWKGWMKHTEKELKHAKMQMRLLRAKIREAKAHGR